MIGVDSMASGHFFGDRDAFDVNSLVALSDAPQVEIANGAQLAPTHRGVVPLRVRGHGAYAGDDRIVMIQNVNYVPGFPVHRRLLSPGRLERDSTVDGVQRVFIDSLIEEIQRKSRVREWAPQKAPRIRAGVTKKDQKAELKKNQTRRCYAEKKRFFFRRPADTRQAQGAKPPK